MDSFTCACCGGTFHSHQSEADLIMEYQSTFTEEMRALEMDLPVRVCDPCYRAIMDECPPEQALQEYRRHLGSS